MVGKTFNASGWFLTGLLLCVTWLMQPQVAEAKASKQTAKQTSKQSASESRKVASKKASSRKPVASKSSARKVSAARSAKAARTVSRREAVSERRSASANRARSSRVAAVAPRARAQAESLPAFTRIAVKAPLTPARSATGLSAASGATGASFGQIYGLHHTQDPLELKSSVALVVDQDTNEVMLSKNTEAVLPIASLTKLMTALVMVEAHLSLDEMITITSDDVDTEKNSSSRLAVGATLSRGELLHLALMSSENRAAHALGRTYPAGLQAFVGAMNAKARALGMRDTRYVDPTGLNSGNQASARDLALMAKAAYQHPLIRELSVSPEYAVKLGTRQVQFRNTNSLVRNPSWDIGLQKTGYIVEAGRCLVMQASMAGRKFILVFLDSAGKYSRLADAERVRRWIENASHNAAQKGTISTVSAVKVTS